MVNLINNELIKIFKRKNIYILLLIGLVVITTYNLFQKLGNNNVNMIQQYQRIYNNDVFLLENYDIIDIEDNYEDIVERLKLEEYAIKNNIRYNILLNSENTNNTLPKDARILLMQLFDKFDIIIIFIIIYLSSTIMSEELNSGTIKKLLTKPHTRLDILFSKIIVSILITILVVSFIVIFQYLLGGFLFSFDSYSLDAIRYNSSTQNIETMNLSNYMILIVVCKIPMYLQLMLVSILFGIVTNNIALNILLSLGVYFISTMKFLITNISKIIFVFNMDISNYLFENIKNITQAIWISSISIIILFILIMMIFKKKDIRNV